MTTISSVSKTAKLLRVKGSPAVRGKLAENLNYKFSQMIDEKIQTQGFITKKDIKTFLKRLAPNVAIHISETPPNSRYSGALRVFSLFGKIAGYKLEMPFDGDLKILDSRGILVLFHEVNHFFRAITEPKYVNKIKAKRVPLSKQDNAHSFYTSKIYNLGYILLEKDSFKAEIKKFFKSQNCSRKEKVKILHNWLLNLQDEKKAYTYEIDSEIDHDFKVDFLVKKLTKNETLPPVNYKYKWFGVQCDINSNDELGVKIEKLKFYINELKKRNYEKIIKNKHEFPLKIETIKEMFFTQVIKIRAEHRALIKAMKTN